MRCTVYLHFHVKLFAFSMDVSRVCGNCLSIPSGDVSCLATIPSDVEAEATFIAKADGVIAGISLADMIFNQVDPSLKVSIYVAYFLPFEVFEGYDSIGIAGGINCPSCSFSTDVAGRMVLK